ncbi:MAG: MBOAT family protein [Bacteroidetes bacterium]|nr:MBOAT family protein [Bacteroidota bacterium]
MLLFPVTLLLYYLAPFRFRWAVLLAASFVFYGWYSPSLLLLMLGLVSLNFGAGSLIEQYPLKIGPRVFLIAVFLNIITLVFFKYLGFLTVNLLSLASLLHWNYPVNLLSFLLPVGLSFMVFQLLAYLIEVKRGTIYSENHFGIFSLYILYFPKVTAGPIERPNHLIPQFRMRYPIDPKLLTSGLLLMGWGFFKKIVVADRLALITAPVFDQPDQYSGLPAFLAVVLYSFQIYADFSGYTDIALGSSLMFGIRLTQNFKTPYFSRSIQEFWTRWHITLSTWLRDYLFLPVSYSTSRTLKQNRTLGIPTDYVIYAFATMVTMLLCGLWHGAGWTFIIWGGLHGIYLVTGFISRKIKKKLNHALQWKKDNFLRTSCDRGVVFLLVSFSWIFFRSASPGQAWNMIIRIFSPGTNWINTGFIKDWNTILITLLFLGFLILMDWMGRRDGICALVAKSPVLFRWAFYLLLLWSVLIFGRFGEAQFIYYQF